uniref:TLC domain-containing protein n=1 Tax=Lotharella globosa TaxID=91324 RepID=A0A7S3YPV9_9EUKA
MATNGILTAASGAAPWFFISQGLFWTSHYASENLSRTYNKLDPAIQSYWCASAISSLHGAVISYWGFAAASTAGLWTTDDFFKTTSQTTGCCNVLVGYLCSDLALSLYYGGRWPGNTANIIHHITAILAFIQMSAWGFGHSLGMMIIVLETTTPFVNQRWFFEKTGMKVTHPALYVANGLAMVILWFLLRILLVGWVGIRLIAVREQVASMAWPQVLTVVCTYAVGYGLQFFWFYKILRGAIKALSKVSGKKLHSG